MQQKFKTLKIKRTNIHIYIYIYHFLTFGAVRYFIVNSCNHIYNQLSPAVQLQPPVTTRVGTSLKSSLSHSLYYQLSTDESLVKIGLSVLCKGKLEQTYRGTLQFYNFLQIVYSKPWTIQQELHDTYSETDYLFLMPLQCNVIRPSRCK